MRQRLRDLYVNMLSYALLMQGIKCTKAIADQIEQRAGFLADNTMLLKDTIYKVYIPVYRVTYATLQGSVLVFESTDTVNLPVVYNVIDGKFSIHYLDNPDGFGDRLFVGDCLNEVN